MKPVGYFLSFLFVVSLLPVSAQQVRSIRSQPTAPVSPISSGLTQSIAPAIPVLTPELQNKVLSGGLLMRIAQKNADVSVNGVTDANTFITASIYASAYPSPAFLASLEAVGVRSTPESWIPPLENHPLGFFLALIPTDRLVDVLAIADVRKVDTAEREAVPQNNLAAIQIKATLAWASNWTGTGVKVGVLDSGFDDRMATSELPTPVAKRDYYNYPTSIDTTVRNIKSAHGTHVVGSVLGRGGYSAANTGNGGGSYKGMAPAADLVFLKIGGDASSNASSAAIVGAAKAAVDSFGVKVLSMSYGGWDTFHDGSDDMCQAIDYAYSKGAACFISAGNDGAAGLHYSGTAPAHDTSDYIEIAVTNNTGGYYLAFNLVWRDGAARNGLKTIYYTAAKAPIATITRLGNTESQRGTESEISYVTSSFPAGSGTYYIRVVNPSAVAQPFHEYFYSVYSGVAFKTPDPFYTVGSPAIADHAFAVGAYTSRVNWISSLDGLSYAYNQPTTLAGIAYFSSLGPRIDGVQKPDITAPGAAIISLRDRDVVTATSALWVDNDGTTGGISNYYVMEGTSMATPVCAGAAALLYQHSPLATPQLVYDAIRLNAIVDGFTGGVPNSTWGYGKLDVNTAITNIPLPVELSSFTASAKGNVVTLNWKTASEVNNYGFEIEKRPVVRIAGSMVQTTADVQTWTKAGFASGSGTTNAPREYSYTEKLTGSGAYAYRLKQIDRDGKFEYSKEVEVTPAALPIEYSLGANYPNPFNPVTHFQFSIGADQHVRVAVYDLLGRAVAELVNEPMVAGRYTVEWNASAATSGVYFYRIDAGNFSAVRKLVLQK